VELVEDGCSVPAEWPEAMSRGLASMHVEDVRIVVTNRFVKTVSELTGKPAYTADRGGGAVAARTVTGPDGSMVVVNYGEMASRSLADIERTLAHEAGHVLINARGTEETKGNRDSAETDWQWWLKCVGALATVEFRIERTLADLGYPTAELAAPSAIEQNLLVTNAEVISAVIDPASADPVHLRDAVFTTLDHITKTLAYIAAPIAAGQPGFSPLELSNEGQANWADYIAPTWQRRLDLWRSVLPVAEPVPVKAWRTILRKSAALEQEFLRDFGFAFSNEPNGCYGFWRTASDELLEKRLQRARIQTGTQGE
jgi:hypothetical protein